MIGILVQRKAVFLDGLLVSLLPAESVTPVELTIGNDRILFFINGEHLFVFFSGFGVSA